jgi:hypothetical protein
MPLALASLGGLGLVLGALLPWISAGLPGAEGVSANGLRGGSDGIYTLVGGVYAIVTAIAISIGRDRMPSLAGAPRRTPVSLVVVGVGAGVVMAFDLERLNDAVARAKALSPLVSASLGAGVFVTFVGAGLLLVAGTVLWRAGRAGGLGAHPRA